MHGLVRSSMAVRYAVRKVLAFAAGAAIAVVFAGQAAAIVDARVQRARLLADRERDQRVIADLVRGEREASVERDRMRERLESARAEFAATRMHLDQERQRTAAAINRDLEKALKREHARVVMLEESVGSAVLPTLRSCPDFVETPASSGGSHASRQASGVLQGSSKCGERNRFDQCASKRASRER